MEDAVMASAIEPGGRHILLTLLSRTTAATAEIPARHAPTFDEMEAMTGLARSTLIEWMKALTDSKWIVREALEGETRQGIRIMIGDPKAERIKRVRKSKVADASYRDAVQDDGGSGPTDVPPRGTAHTATRYADVPRGGMPDDPHCLKDFPTESQTLTDPDHAADAAATDGGFAIDFGPRAAAEPEQKNPKTKNAPKEETGGQRTNRIARLYTDKVKLVAFHGVRQAVDAAFKTGDYSEEQITAAISDMADARLPISQTSLRIAIEGRPEWGNRNNQPGSSIARVNDGQSRRDGLDRNGIRSPADQRIADAQPLYEKYKRQEQENARG